MMQVNKKHVICSNKYETQATIWDIYDLGKKMKYANNFLGTKATVMRIMNNKNPIYQLLTCSVGNEFLVWDIKTQIFIERGFFDVIPTCCVWWEKGQCLVANTDFQGICFISWKSGTKGKIVKTLGKTNLSNCSLKVDEARDQLMVISDNRDMFQVWDLNPCEISSSPIVHSWNKPFHTVCRITETIFAISNGNGRVDFYDFSSCKILKTKCNSKPIKCFLYSGPRRLLILCGDDGKVKIWKIEILGNTIQIDFDFNVQNRYNVGCRSLAFLNNEETRILVGDCMKNMFIIDLESRTYTEKYPHDNEENGKIKQDLEFSVL